MSSHNVLQEIYGSSMKQADPGDAGRLSGGDRVFTYFGLITAGAETRTLSAPTKVGQQVTLYFATDNGNCVVTSDVAINVAGNTIMTFADARDKVKMEAIESGGTLYWSVVSNDGAVALS